MQISHCKQGKLPKQYPLLFELYTPSIPFHVFVSILVCPQNFAIDLYGFYSFPFKIMYFFGPSHLNILTFQSLAFKMMSLIQKVKCSSQKSFLDEFSPRMTTMNMPKYCDTRTISYGYRLQIKLQQEIVSICVLVVCTK